LDIEQCPVLASFNREDDPQADDQMLTEATESFFFLDRPNNLEKFV
jgi:hypothetical protein